MAAGAMKETKANMGASGDGGSQGVYAGGRARGTAALLPIEMVRPSPYGPRRWVDAKALRALAEEVKETGRVEPVVVWRRKEEGWRYIILEGDLRWRAALKAGLRTLPAQVRDISDERTAERLTLIECLRRERHTPVVEAEALARLVALGMSHERIAAAVYRSRTAISYALRLLELPEDVRRLIELGALKERHGRALHRFVPWPNVLRWLAKRALREGWSCARLERERPEDYGLVIGVEVAMGGEMEEVGESLEETWRQMQGLRWVVAAVDTWREWEGIGVEVAALVGTGLVELAGHEAAMAAVERLAPERLAGAALLVDDLEEGEAPVCVATGNPGGGRCGATAQREAWGRWLYAVAKEDAALAVKIGAEAFLRREVGERQPPWGAWGTWLPLRMAA